MAVSYQDVCKAADDLSKNNITVSVRSVRDITRGSHSQIAPLLEQWKRDNPIRPHSLPDNIQKAITDHFAAIMANHEKDLQTENEANQELRDQIDDLNNRLTQADRKRIEAELQMDFERKKAEMLESRVGNLEEQLRVQSEKLISKETIIQIHKEQIDDLRESFGLPRKHPLELNEVST